MNLETGSDAFELPSITQDSPVIKRVMKEQKIDYQTALSRLKKGAADYYRAEVDDRLKDNFDISITKDEFLALP